MKNKKKSFLFLFGLIFCLSFLMMKTNLVSAEEYICPESNSKYLKDADIKDLTLQELNYAKNEIYARHGYLFKSQELRDYFGQFSWYNGTIPGSKFSEDVFNSYEKKNVNLLSSTEKGLAQGGYPLDTPGYNIHAVRTGTTAELDVKEISEETIKSMRTGKVEKLGNAISLDLDNDGKQEEIGLVFLGEPDGHNQYYDGKYALQVNEKNVIGHGDNIYEDLYGVCLGSDQIYIIVYQDGPSDDPGAEFFLWKENKLTSIGEIFVYIDDIKTDGNGLISGWQRTNVIDTNAMYGEWELTADGTLGLGGSGNYEMSRKEYQLKKSIHVYESNDRHSRSRKIDPQDISVESTDGGNWVYIKAKDGKWGWFEAGTLSYEEKNSTFGGMLFAG